MNYSQVSLGKPIDEENSEIVYVRIINQNCPRDLTFGKVYKAIAENPDWWQIICDDVGDEHSVDDVDAELVENPEMNTAPTNATVDVNTIFETIEILDKFKKSIMEQLNKVRQYEIDNPHVVEHRYPEKDRFHSNATNYSHECLSRKGISYYFENFTFEHDKIFANVMISGFEYDHQLTLDVSVDHYAVYVAQYEQWEANYQERLAADAKKKEAAELAQYEKLRAKYGEF